MNKKRIELNLITIKKGWNLDSIENLTDDYNIFDEKPNLWGKIKDQNIYCQNWSLKDKDTLKPYHKIKRIFYIESFWFWKNKIEYEVDIFNNPISKMYYYELRGAYDFINNKNINRIDTIETVYKIQKDKKHNDSISKLGYFSCGNHLINIKLDLISISNSKVDEILKNWKIKRN